MIFHVSGVSPLLQSAADSTMRRSPFGFAQATMTSF
jgi:hypothetical protein